MADKTNRNNYEGYAVTGQVPDAKYGETWSPYNSVNQYGSDGAGNWADVYKAYNNTRKGAKSVYGSNSRVANRNYGSAVPDALQERFNAIMDANPQWEASMNGQAVNRGPYTMMATFNTDMDSDVYNYQGGYKDRHNIRGQKEPSPSLNSRQGIRSGKMGPLEMKYLQEWDTRPGRANNQGLRYSDGSYAYNRFMPAVAAVPFGMAMAGNDPVMNTVGGAGMVGASALQGLTDATMVAQPFVDAYGYVQSPEYIEERRRQMEEGLD